MNVRRVVAAVTAVAVMFGVVIAGNGGTAYAGIPGLATADIDIFYVFDSFRNVVGFDVCADGLVDDGTYSGIGQWVYVVDGQRSNGGIIFRMIGPKPGGSFHDCYRITKDVQPAGQVVIELTFFDPAIDVTTSASGLITWDPVLGDRPTSTGV